MIDKEMRDGKELRRIRRERKTIEAMIDLYCRDQHGFRDALCSDCITLLAYAFKKLEHCPFGTAEA